MPCAPFWRLVVAAQAHAVEYYIYRDSKGGLVSSNQKPPAGSQIIKQHNFPEVADSETPPLTNANDKRPNGDTNSSKPPPNK